MKKLIYPSLLLLFVTMTILLDANDDMIALMESKTAYAELTSSVSSSNDKILAESEMISEPDEQIEDDNGLIISEPEAVSLLSDSTKVSSKANNQIEIKKKRYYYNDKLLVRKELATLMLSEPESAAIYKKSRTTATVGLVLQETIQIGGFIVTGFSLGGILLSTVGALAVGLPIAMVSDNQLLDAVSLYNLKQNPIIESNIAQNKSVAELKITNRKPTDKGNYLIGGGVNGGLNGFNKDNKGSLYGSLSPNFGYFVLDGLAVGVGISASFNSSLNSDSDFFSSSSGIGPYAKYYTPSGFFIGTTIRYSNSLYRNSTYNYYGDYSTYKDIDKIFTLNPSVGYAFFINSKIAIEAAFNYTHYIDHYSRKYSSDYSDYSGEYSDNSLYFSVGFQLFW